MRSARKVMAAVAVGAVALGASASPAFAEEEPDQPDSPPFRLFANVESEGELLPICLNTVRITAFDNTIVNLPQTCVG